MLQGQAISLRRWLVVLAALTAANVAVDIARWFL